MVPDIFKDDLFISLKKLEKWVEDNNYKGYEPFDGLTSYFRPLTFGNLLFDRILMQIIRQCPVNLRPLAGIKFLDSRIGRGYMAWGYLKMYKQTGDSDYKRKAEACLNWLIKKKAPAYDEYSWGKEYDYASRGGRYPKYEPIVVWSGLIGQAFLDGFELIKEKKYLDVADSVCRWVIKLPREKTGSGSCISYYVFDQSSIHNSNMIGGAILARTAKYTDNKEYLEVAREAMEYSCSRQLQNGSWFYGEEPKYRWIDNFHTGYNLDSLKCYIENTGDNQFEPYLFRGFQFYKNNFFEPSGRPKYYHNKVYPVDSQCASQSIDTLTYFKEYDKSSLSLAVKVAKWIIDNMQDRNGYIYYRQYPLIKAKMPMIHWAQATTYKAFAFLLSTLH